MADKTSTGILGVGTSQTLVTTAGSIDPSTVTIAFDDAQTSANVIDAIERAKSQVVAYYLKRAS